MKAFKFSGRVPPFRRSRASVGEGRVFEANTGDDAIGSGGDSVDDGAVQAVELAYPKPLSDFTQWSFLRNDTFSLASRSPEGWKLLFPFPSISLLPFPSHSLLLCLFPSLRLCNHFTLSSQDGKTVRRQLWSLWLWALETQAGAPVDGASSIMFDIIEDAVYWCEVDYS